MATMSAATYKLTLTNNNQTPLHQTLRQTSMCPSIPPPLLVSASIPRQLITVSASYQEDNESVMQRFDPGHLSRRLVLGGMLGAAALGSGAEEALAVKQNMLAGRLPALSEVDEEGFRTYKRPEGKSGGHGVGWSIFEPYTFKVPDGWEEIPVSIADLGGTEIDLRFRGKDGDICVVVAPVLRFADLGENPTIEQIGSPEKVINAFGPELTGQVVDDKVVDMGVLKRDGRTYYNFELNAPHMLISSTAGSNRLYLFSVSANARQWKKAEATLRTIQDSFRVVPLEL